MLVAKKHLFEETDARLSANFTEAGFGFQSEPTALFHPLEAGYLVKIGKSQFKSGTFQSFIASQKKKDRLFPFAFAAYCQIRATGKLVRPYMKEANFFRVYAPGVGREENRPSQLVCLLPGAAPSPKSLAEQIKIAHLARLDLIIASGAEKEIKYYKISSFNF